MKKIKQKHTPRPAKLALDDIEPKYRSAVVTADRAAAKRKRPPTERQFRQLRFIWMRAGSLTTKHLPALNWIDFGGLVCRGLVSVPNKGRIEVTAHGHQLLVYGRGA